MRVAWCVVRVAAAWCALLAAGGAAQLEDITVVRKQMSLGEEATLMVDNSVEYIVLFLPSSPQPAATRLIVRSAGADVASPLLLTARQRTGASTWQLPYYAGDTLLYELERTLCPRDIVQQQNSTECGDPATQDASEFTLHVGSSCAVPFPVTVRAEPAANWLLSTMTSTRATVTQASPAVHHYRFTEGQDSVRLAFESEDDVCATVAVQDYSCPIAGTLVDIERTSLRMTVLRSGAVHLSRSRFPRGLFVIVAVGDTDEPCTGEAAEEPAPQWLWDALWSDADVQVAERPRAPRSKRVTLNVRDALSRSQYAVGAAVTMAVFLGFYLMFGALVLAQRIPRWRALVGPRAVLAETKTEARGLTEAEVAADAAARTTRRRRRDSDATFDSSDNSDTDESDAETGPSTTQTVATGSSSRSPASPASPAEPVAAPVPISIIELNNEIQNNTDRERGRRERAEIAQDGVGAAAPAERAFGLPARLRVAALARRRAHVLRARSDRYLYTLYTVAVFYALPVVQFVITFQIFLNLSGSLDLCYFNFLCAHPLAGLSDFNHVFSNVGYLLLGALFMLQEYGIPPHYGMLSSLGAGMMVVALLSASYHVCPNRLNFQFDTAFMYVLAVLSMVKIYQARHPDINARAHATFAVLAVFIALVVWGVIGGGPLFWSIFTVLHVFTFLLLSLRIYYVGQFRLEKESLAETARALRASDARPMYAWRLGALVVANAVNWGFALYGLITQSADIASHLLNVLLCNTLLYMVFYLAMKLLHGERPRWYAWLYLAGAGAAWGPALYLFLSGSTSWSSMPAQSRLLNHECRVLHFYDSHDLWHILSAVALYFTFNAMLTWDDGLAAVKRTDIAVF